MDDPAEAILQLADRRRHVAELHRDVRHDPDPADAWERSDDRPPLCVEAGERLGR